MNTAQRKILKGSLVAIVITLLFPPFLVGLPNGGTIGLGYGFIASWPSMSGNNHLVGHIDVAMLLAEWLSIGVVSAILWKLGRNPREPSLAVAILSRNDALVESARIEAAGRERAAEIMSGKP